MELSNIVDNHINNIYTSDFYSFMISNIDFEYIKYWIDKKCGVKSKFGFRFYNHDFIGIKIKHLFINIGSVKIKFSEDTLIYYCKSLIENGIDIHDDLIELFIKQYKNDIKGTI